MKFIKVMSLTLFHALFFATFAFAGASENMCINETCIEIPDKYEFDVEDDILFIFHPKSDDFLFIQVSPYEGEDLGLLAAALCKEYNCAIPPEKVNETYLFFFEDEDFGTSYATITLHNMDLFFALNFGTNEDLEKDILEPYIIK